MQPVDAELLHLCHKDFLNIFFGDFPLDAIHTRVSKRVTGFGMNTNEKTHSYQEFAEMVSKQRRESEEAGLTFRITPISNSTFNRGTAALHLDHITVNASTDNRETSLEIHFSSVFELLDDQWKAIHFHSSAPGNTGSISGTLESKLWKENAETMELLLVERTEELRTSLEELKRTRQRFLKKHGLRPNFSSPRSEASGTSRLND